MSAAETRHTVHVILSHREGALVRLLGLVERRGFRLQGVNAGLADDVLHVTLELTSGRDAAALCRQISRLVDVVSAQLPAA